MAENKKSVLLYCDLITTVEKLSDTNAGLLFKHFLRYVNDKNPEAPNELIDVVFEPIKQNLKRDLKKWEDKSLKNRESALMRWNANASERTKNNANHADKDTVTVTDTVKVIVKENNIEDRKLKFARTLNSFSEKYPKELISNFIAYWTEPNKSNTKFRQELEKTWDLERRLNTWACRDESFKSNKPKFETPETPTSINIPSRSKMPVIPQNK